MTDDLATVTSVLSAWRIEPRSVHRITSGLIHQTWAVAADTGSRYVLQRLHQAIRPQVNDTIAAVCTHLKMRGLATPELVPLPGGATSWRDPDYSWRVLTYVDGESFQRVRGPNMAEAAGGLLGRFHAALIDYRGFDTLPESTVHEPARHLAGLRTALDEHRDHEHYAPVADLAERIFTAAAALSAPASNVLRAVHGDPKISNVLFDDAGRAVCLVDLDTIARMRLGFELGDAFRSWCNPHGEDREDTVFDLALLAAAARGYARHAGAFITEDEIHDIVPGIETIYTELAARFLADALNERYFAWDPARFETRSAHNLTRARGQFNAMQHLSKQRAAAVDAVAGAFAR